MYFTLQVWIISFLIILLIIAITNNFLIKKINMNTDIRLKQRVSILIPARNEEKNIENCVNSLLNQDYDNFEVIVLNDNSEDDTNKILEKIKKENKKLKVIQGKKLPSGWYGKHWACHQLANEASGSIILFTDADTIHKSNMLKVTVEIFLKENLDILSAFVKEEVVTLGEKLTVPFPTWSIFAILPLIIGYNFKNRAFTAINGQFMMFKRKSYELIGGHAAVKSDAVDDIALGKEIKKHGLKWRIYDATSYVSCRMYRNFKEAFQGFSKNYFAIFEYKIIPSTLVWLWLVLITWQPIIHILLNLDSLLNISSLIAFLSILLNFIIWLITLKRFKMPISIVFLYPIIMFLASFIGIRSMILTLLGNTQWKGRILSKSKIKWI